MQAPARHFLTNAFISELKKQHKNILLTAPTGIAAINIKGITMHKAFKIPIPAYGEGINPNSYKMLMCADVVIVDEISTTTNRPPLSAGLKGCGILYSGRDIRYSFTLP